MAKKPATKEEKQWMDKISKCPCVICGKTPVEVHHITECGRRLGHLFTLPLCLNCHRGDDGFSGKNRDSWDKSLDNQLRLLAGLCMSLIHKEPIYKTKIVPRNI